MALRLFLQLLVILTVANVGFGLWIYRRESWVWVSDNMDLMSQRKYNSRPCYLEGSKGSGECPRGTRIYHEFPESVSAMCKPKKNTRRKVQNAHGRLSSWVKGRYPMCGSREEMERQNETPYKQLMKYRLRYEEKKRKMSNSSNYLH